MNQSAQIFHMKIVKLLQYICVFPCSLFKPLPASSQSFIVKTTQSQDFWCKTYQQGVPNCQTHKIKDPLTSGLLKVFTQNFDQTFPPLRSFDESSLVGLAQVRLVLSSKNLLKKRYQEPGAKSKLEIFVFLSSSCRASQNEGFYQFYENQTSQTLADCRFLFYFDL